ncbi:ATP synthase subunit e, mitochondrial [Atheta coriaria]|uniref:ATP synthase subunit e, mitochondrial n=1 Tax=Dalotia coriaria TaxID=877792 RepID=UPI0031F43C67
MSALPAPVNVSPLIRFGRWGMLSAGIMWGMFHHNRLSKKETAFREVEAKQKVARDAKLAAEKKAASDKEMKDLEAALSGK